MENGSFETGTITVNIVVRNANEMPTAPLFEPHLSNGRLPQLNEHGVMHSILWLPNWKILVFSFVRPRSLTMGSMDTVQLDMGYWSCDAFGTRTLLIMFRIPFTANISASSIRPFCLSSTSPLFCPLHVVKSAVTSFQRNSMNDLVVIATQQS